LDVPYKLKIPLDYMIVEVIFAELFHMPAPRYLEVCYGSIFIELCKLHPSRMPQVKHKQFSRNIDKFVLYSQVLAQATELLFSRVDSMNTSCFDR
jgi:nuclear cap-binding protein subunit 1